MSTNHSKILTLTLVLVGVMSIIWLAPQPALAACDGWCSGMPQSQQPYYRAGDTCRYSVPIGGSCSNAGQTCWGQTSVWCATSNNCTSSGCQTVSCTPNWQCGAWGTCDGYSQTRTCTDTNNCGTSAGRPDTWQTCTSCSPTSSNWSAWSSWSTCTATCGGGTWTRTRTCQGTVSCGGTNNCTGNSSETQSCNTQACAVAVNGACGTNATSYSATTTSYTGSFCSAGSASPSSPAFPAQGSSVSWTCQGANGGSNAACSAERALATPTVSVSPSTVAAGGTVTFSWGASTNATYYYRAYRRDGVWDASFIDIGNVTSQNFTTTGLTSSIAAGVLACNSNGCSEGSNVAVASIATAPNVDFTASPTSDAAPLSVAFTSSNSGGSITSYSWNFGDGPPAGSGANPTRNYTTVGTYSVTVLATGPGGSSAKTRTNYITVNPPPPATPALTVSPTTFAPGATVTFSWNAPATAAYYFINYRRDGTWGTPSNIDNVTSINYATTGLTSSAAAAVAACNVSGCSEGSNIAVATITPAPTADIKANNSNGNVNIAYNTAASISWTSSNASSCSVSPGNWTGTSNTGVSTGNLTVMRTYTLTCTGLGGTTTDSIAVNVATPEVTVTGFTANPASGTAPVNGVDFTTSVGGTAIGDIHYQIDCTNNGSYEVDVTRSANSYTAVDACNYVTGGNYTAKVVATRDLVAANQTLALNLTHSPATVDIKANNVDGPINVPANSNVQLSWSSTYATACTASGDWSGSQALQSSGTSQSITTAAKTFTLNCTGLGASASDSVTVNPVPLVPANLRITSATPFIKGNTITFAWDAAPAASFYVAAYYFNGVWDLDFVSPSPQSATTISYSSTANLNSLGAVVLACKSPNICSQPTSLVTAALLDPIPVNLAPTGTGTAPSSISASLSSSTDVDYVRISPLNTDMLYRVRVLPGSPSDPTVTVTVVDGNGNVINNSSIIRIESVGTDVIVKVPAGSGGEKYLKFQGSKAGDYGYTLKRVRLFPYLEAQ